VWSDIPGATGMAMIRALIAGERERVQLARFRDPRGASRTEDRATAWTGHERPAPAVALKPALARYDVSTAQVRECEAAIAPPFQAIKPVWHDDLPPVERADKRRSHGKTAPASEARHRRDELTGIDLVAIPGLHASPAPTLLSALGLEMQKWPKAKACCAWLGLAPRHEISGGKGWRRGTLKPRNHAGQALRLAAPAVSRSHTSLGACYRRLRARLGPQSAIVATAHKRARLVDHRLRYRTPFRDISAAADEQRARERDIAALRKKATRLGFTRGEPPR